MHNVLKPKPNCMRSILTLLFIITTTTSVFSQEQKEWTLYSSVNGVDIYFQETNCTTDAAPAQVAYIIKLVNTSQSNVRISWNLAVWYNNEKLTANVSEGENHYELDLTANQTLIGDCNTPFGALYIFKDFITYVSPTKLTRFELENITVANI